MVWSHHCPEDCPFEDAIEPSFEVYRLVKNNPPSSKDFLSRREMRPQEKFEKSELYCQACGTSVYRDIKDIELKKSLHRGFRRTKIAVGMLTPDLGLIKNTKCEEIEDSHHTFWFPENSEPWIVFEIVD